MKRAYVFFASTFAITWISWWTLAARTTAGAWSYGEPAFMALYMLGGFGPTIAAYIALLRAGRGGLAAGEREGGSSAIAEFHARLFSWRLPVRWWAAALLLPFALAAAAVATGVAVDASLRGALELQPLYMLVPYLGMMVIGGGLEELGWRGVALPELLRRTRPLTASLIVGVAWWLWHLPLFHMPGVPQHGTNYWIYGAGVIGLSMILTWLWVRSGSILLCVLFHAAVNAAGAMGLSIPDGHLAAGLLDALLKLGLGLGLVLRLGPTAVAPPAPRARRATGRPAASTLTAVAAVLASLAGPGASGPALAQEPADARAILQRYADAWRGAEEMELPDTVVLGFDIAGDGGGRHHIVLPPDGAASLRAGPASNAFTTFETDIAFLRRLDRGELNALTAMAQARGTDPIPLTPRFADDFRWTSEARGMFLPLLFHFWNREWPEVVPFGEALSRQVHGGNAVIFYYDQGLRTGWYQVEPGMHMNEDPADQTNPFDTLLVVIRGAFNARLDGVERVLREGETVLVPAGMTHEFWAAAGQTGEFIIIMFGDSA